MVQLFRLVQACPLPSKLECRAPLGCMTSCVDWVASAPIFLHNVVSSCQDRGDTATIQQLRLICRAWSTTTSQAIRQWRPHYSCNDAKVIALARGFPSLRVVNLEACHSRHKVDLVPILSLTALQELHLGNHAIEVPSDSSQALEGLTQLQSLDFCPIGDVSAFNLSCLQRLSSLHVRGPEIYTVPGGNIDCYENKVAAQALLQQAISLQHLREIALLRLALNAAAFQAMSSLTQIHFLSVTEVVHTEYITGSGPKSLPSLASFEAMCQLVDLKELTIRESLVYLRSVASISKLKQLTKLDLQGARSLESLDGLQHVSALQWLNVSDVFSISSLEPIRSLTGLSELRFARCLMVQSSGGVDVLSNLTNLQVVDMQCCAFSSSWIQLLTGLSALHHLDMSVGNWRDQDIAQLTACSSLRFLGLRDCPSTTRSMHQILQERLPSLETIQVACSTSGDQYAGFLGWPY